MRPRGRCRRTRGTPPQAGPGQDWRAEHLGVVVAPEALPPDTGAVEDVYIYVCVLYLMYRVYLSTYTYVDRTPGEMGAQSTSV